MLALLLLSSLLSVAVGDALVGPLWLHGLHLHRALRVPLHCCALIHLHFAPRCAGARATSLARSSRSTFTRATVSGDQLLGFLLHYFALWPGLCLSQLWQCNSLLRFLPLVWPCRDLASLCGLCRSLQRDLLCRWPLASYTYVFLPFRGWQSSGVPGSKCLAQLRSAAAVCSRPERFHAAVRCGQCWARLQAEPLRPPFLSSWAPSSACVDGAVPTQPDIIEVMENR
jgi:hypothetical protein